MLSNWLPTVLLKLTQIVLKLNLVFKVHLLLIHRILTAASRVSLAILIEELCIVILIVTEARIIKHSLINLLQLTLTLVVWRSLL